MDFTFFIQIFVIIPLLLYTGINIISNRINSNVILFHLTLLFVLTLMLFLHLRYLIRVMFRILQNKRYEHEFGMFLILLAFFMLLLCIKDMYYPRL